MEKAAFLQLIQENKGILYKISASYCRNVSDREDLIQEMIYQLWRSAERFDANYKFTTWMYRIALNVAISFYRKSSRSGVKVTLDTELHLTEDLVTHELDERIRLLQRFIGALKVLAQ